MHFDNSNGSQTLLKFLSSQTDIKPTLHLTLQQFSLEKPTYSGKAKYEFMHPEIRLHSVSAGRILAYFMAIFPPRREKSSDISSMLSVSRISRELEANIRTPGVEKPKCLCRSS